LGTTSLVSGSHHNKGPFLRTNSSQKKLTREAKPKNLIAELSQEIIGEDQIFNGPFGLRKGKTWLNLKLTRTKYHGS